MAIAEMRIEQVRRVLRAGPAPAAGREVLPIEQRRVIGVPQQLPYAEVLRVACHAAHVAQHPHRVGSRAKGARRHSEHAFLLGGPDVRKALDGDFEARGAGGIGHAGHVGMHRPMIGRVLG